MAQEKEAEEAQNSLVRKQTSTSTSSSSVGKNNNSSSRRLKLNSLKNYLHSSKSDLKSSEQQQQQNSSLSKGPEKCKSMMTLNIGSGNGSNQHQQSSLFSFPSQLRLVEKINHHRREWMAARFCSNGSGSQNNILSPGSLLQQATRQPLAIWSKSSTAVIATKMVVDDTGTGGQQQMNTNFNSSGNNKTDAIELLLQLKGANWRHRQLQHQMPIHDAELLRQPTAESRFIRGKQRRALVRSELFLASSVKPVTCHRCKQLISGGACVKIGLTDWLNGSGQKSNGTNSISTSTTNTPNHFFHIDCFKCEECQEVLVDLKAYLHQTTSTNSTTAFDHHQSHQNHQNHQQTLVNHTNGNSTSEPTFQYSLFCCRHFVEIFKPRCPHCDRLILDEECTEAEGKAWHIGHFCCTECSRSLGGQQYIMASAEVVNRGKPSAEGSSNSSNSSNRQMPYCLTCFDILFGELCEECGELIGCEVGAIIHEGRSWHATDACFRCSLCLKTLLGKPFLPAMDGRIYCSLTCSQAMVSHQREKARRSNRLHGLQQHESNQKKRNATGVSATSKIAEPPEAKSKVQQQQSPSETMTSMTNRNFSSDQEKSTSTETKSLKLASTINNIIKENRDQFLKSMTLSRYEQKVKQQQNQQAQQNRSAVNGSPNPSLNLNSNSKQDHVDDYAARLKALNLSHLVNYEQFIRQSNQYFTSKYDWSKEQEFLARSPVPIRTTHVDQHEQAMSSSLTTATLSDAEENSLGIIKPLNNSTQLTSSECSNSLERSSPAYFTGGEYHYHRHQHLLNGGSLLHHPNHHLYSTINHHHQNNATSSQTTATSTSSTDISSRFTLPPPNRTTGDRLPNKQTSSSPSPLTSSHSALPPPHRPIYYNLVNGDNKNSSLLNSPANSNSSSSNETPPSWTSAGGVQLPLSPPPEYSKLQLVADDGGESSVSVSSSTTGQHGQQKQHEQQQSSRVKMTNGILKSSNSSNSKISSKISSPLMEETLLVQKLLLSKNAAMELPSSSLEASPSPPETTNTNSTANNSDSDTGSFPTGPRQPSSVDTNNSPRLNQQFPQFALQQQQFHNLHPQQTSTPLSQQQQHQQMMQIMMQQNSLNHQQQQLQMHQQIPVASGSNNSSNRRGNNEHLQMKQPVSATKSVSFDPNIEDKDESQRRYIRRLRANQETRHRQHHQLSEELLHEECSDSHSCSSCSTCSTSSSDDDDDLGDFDLVNYRSGDQKQKGVGEGQTTNTSNDACIIS